MGLAVRLCFVGIMWSLGFSVLLAAFEPIALAVHLEDVDMVSVAVQQRSGEALGPDDLGPLVEGEVGGYHYGAQLVALSEDLEEQFRPGAGGPYWREWSSVLFTELRTSGNLLNS